jgi:hypothetical protein
MYNGKDHKMTWDAFLGKFQDSFNDLVREGNPLTDKQKINMLNKAINCADLNQAMDSYQLDFKYKDATRRVLDTYDRVVTYYTSALMNQKAQATIKQQRRSIASVGTGSDVKSGSLDKKGPSRFFSKAEWEEMKADGTADAITEARKKH